MCLDTACCEMWNGSASSLTLAGPRANRLSIRRRVGSESATNAVLSLSTTIWLWNKCRLSTLAQKEDWRSSDVGIADRSSHESRTVETCRYKKRAIRFT